MENKNNNSQGTYIWAMGGLNEIGKNMYIIESGDDLLVVDSGIKFASQELLGMNGLVPNYSYLENFKGRINILITHGHEDHIGGIPYLLSKLKNIDKIFVPLLPSELIKRKLTEFKSIKLPEMVIYNGDFVIKTKNFEIDFFSVSHSIPDAFGSCIKTPDGIIVTAGDYRFDFGMEDKGTDIHKIVEISKRGVDVFLGESTNAETAGFSETEMIVINNIMDLISEATGRVFLSTFASNLGRIEKLIERSVKIGRKISLIGRSMENNVKTFKSLGLLNAKESDFISAKELDTIPDKEVLVILTGSQGEEKAALNRIANGEHQKITLKESDLVILSSNPIPGNFLNVENLINSLYRSNARIVKHSPTLKVHASGHATASEMQLMFKLINPRFIIPIHGEFKMLKTSMKNAASIEFEKNRVIIITNGQKVLLKDKIAESTEIFVDVSARIIDGKSITNDSEKILLERNEISNEGIFKIILVIDKLKKVILSNPAISTRGVFIVKNSIAMISKISWSLREEIDTLLKSKDIVTDKEIKDKTREIVKFYIWKNKKKNPLISTTIFNQ